MTIAEELKRIIDAKADIKSAILEKGVTVPDDTLLDQYYLYIDQIGESPVAPNDLPAFKKALTDGTAREKYPVGTLLEDTYNGVSNPMIVGQYLDSTNNSKYYGAVGAILIRKYVEPSAMQYGTTTAYNTSGLRSFLGSDYLDNCSNEMKAVISDIDIVAGITRLTDKWFAMSDTELYSNRSSTSEGIAFDYWKKATGLSSPSYAANSGRIVTDRNGVAYVAWTRSLYSTREVCGIDFNGMIGYNAPSQAYGVLPACFISSE